MSNQDVTEPDQPRRILWWPWVLAVIVGLVLWDLRFVITAPRHTKEVMPLITVGSDAKKAVTELRRRGYKISSRPPHNFYLIRLCKRDSHLRVQLGKLLSRIDDDIFTHFVENTPQTVHFVMTNTSGTITKSW